MPHCLDSFCQKLSTLLSDTVWVTSPRGAVLTPLPVPALFVEARREYASSLPVPWFQYKNNLLCKLGGNHSTPQPDKQVTKDQYVPLRLMCFY